MEHQTRPAETPGAHDLFPHVSALRTLLRRQGSEEDRRRAARHIVACDYCSDRLRQFREKLEERTSPAGAEKGEVIWSDGRILWRSRAPDLAGQLVLVRWGPYPELHLGDAWDQAHEALTSVDAAGDVEVVLAELASWTLACRVAVLVEQGRLTIEPPVRLADVNVATPASATAAARALSVAEPTLRKAALVTLQTLWDRRFSPWIVERAAQEANGPTWLIEQLALQQRVAALPLTAVARPTRIRPAFTAQSLSLDLRTPGDPFDQPKDAAAAVAQPAGPTADRELIGTFTVPIARAGGEEHTWSVVIEGECWQVAGQPVVGVRVHLEPYPTPEGPPMPPAGWVVTLDELLAVAITDERGDAYFDGLPPEALEGDRIAPRVLPAKQGARVRLRPVFEGTFRVETGMASDQSSERAEKTQ